MKYEVRQTKVFSKWFIKLKNDVAKIAIARRIERLKDGIFGDVKSIGDGLHELRIDVAKGYRVYFVNKDKKIIILLVGGDKSTQNEDIKTAKKMAKEA